MVVGMHTKDEILEMLTVVPDPEIPVVSIAEMGMLRDVVVDDHVYTVLLTPTYTGCPAMEIIRQDILSVLADKGVHPVQVKMIYDPAWTTDSMSETAKEKMRVYGIAPPTHSSCNKASFQNSTIRCPFCNSSDTKIVSRFGSTACKALCTCKECLQPFEYFKCH